LHEQGLQSDFGDAWTLQGGEKQYFRTDEAA
jgi:hypothetical protein